MESLLLSYSSIDPVAMLLEVMSPFLYGTANDEEIWEFSSPEVNNGKNNNNNSSSSGRISIFPESNSGRNIIPIKDKSGPSSIPIEILVDHVVPFLDRSTHNACLLLCRRARFILTASWWKHSPKDPSRQLPPWPRKIASMDPSCRVRCLTFSDDHSLLACGCFDGKIRSWDVRTGELPFPYEGHWPDEAVVAVAYSSSGTGRDGCSRNRNREGNRRMLASSSTDGTIRIWDVQTNANSTRVKTHGNAWSRGKTADIQGGEEGLSRTITETFSVGSNDDDDDDDMDMDMDIDIDHNDEYENASASSAQSPSSPSCLVCISADNAYSLHFSPDDSYLVSGHLPVSNVEAGLHLTETIQIWDVRTGVRLRRLEGGGVPVGFLPPQSLGRHPLERVHQYCRFHNETERSTTAEHRLISSCGPSKCLKLWSWNRTSYENTEDTNHSNDTVVSISASDDHSDSDPETETAILDHGRCIQRWFLDRFNTVVPVPASSPAVGVDQSPILNPQETTHEEGCELLVATIDGPDSFAVWNTGRPRECRTFCNTSPYEIQFSPDGRKVASVDNFNTVKVWRISDGFLLRTFSGDAGDRGRHSEARSGSSGGGGLFPIHELAFSRNSSTVAVISRCYNEVHLFST